MKLRARGEADKAQRTDAILKAGREIWSRNPFEFTMTEVAGQAGVVKGTLYLYFATKEELLAAVSGQLLAAYLDRVDHALEKRKHWKLSEVAALFSGGMRLPIVPHNERSRVRLAETAERIDARVAGLRRGDSTRFLLCATALLAALGNMNAAREFRHGVTALARGMEKRR